MVIKKHKSLPHALLIGILVFMIAVVSFLSTETSLSAENDYTFRSGVQQTYDNYTMANGSKTYGTFCVNKGIVGINGNYTRIDNSTGSQTSTILSYMAISEDRLSQLRYAIAEVRVLYNSRGIITSERVTSRLPSRTQSRNIGPSLTQDLIWRLLDISNSSKYPRFNATPAFDATEENYFYAPTQGLPRNATGSLVLTGNSTTITPGYSNTYGPFNFNWSGSTHAAIVSLNNDGASKNISPKFLLTSGNYTLCTNPNGSGVINEITLGQNFYIKFPGAVRPRSLTITPKAGSIITGIKEENLFTSNGTVQQPQYNLQFNFFEKQLFAEFLPVSSEPKGKIEKSVTKFNGTNTNGIYENSIELEVDDKALFKVDFTDNYRAGYSAFLGTRDVTEIYTARQLYQIMSHGSTSGRTFKLMNNIDLSYFIADNGVIQIGTSSNPFLGTFDGNGYTLSNFEGSDPLFMGSYSSTTIKNLTMTNARLYSGNPSQLNKAVIIDKVRLIDNCHVQGSINITDASGLTRVAGLAVYAGNETATTAANNCTFTGTIHATKGTGSGTDDIDLMGGIIAYPLGNVSNCKIYNTTISGYVNTVGGIVGRRATTSGFSQTYDVTVSNCYAQNLTVTTSIGKANPNKFGYAIGGIMGNTDETSTGTTHIANCTATNLTIKPASNNPAYRAFGGIVGYGRINNGSNSGSIKNCNSSGSMEGVATYAGGIAGYARSQRIEECYSTINITFNQIVCAIGGIAGYLTGPYDANATHRPRIVNCYYSGNVVNNRTGSVEQTTTYPNDDRYHGLGGIVGVLGHANVETCYATGNVTSSAIFNINSQLMGVGGIAGALDNVNGTAVGHVRNCFALQTRVSIGSTTLTGTNRQIGRVASRHQGATGGWSITLTNNRALQTMQTYINNSDIILVSGGDAVAADENKHGTNVTATQARTLSTYTSQGWSSSIWKAGTTYPELNVAVGSNATINALTTPTAKGTIWRNGDMYFIKDIYNTTKTLTTSEMLDASLNPLSSSNANVIKDFSQNQVFTFYYLTNALAAGNYKNVASTDNDESTSTVIVKPKNTQKFKLNLTKVSEDGVPQPVNGAVFNLYKYSQDNFTSGTSFIQQLSPVGTAGVTTGDLEYGYYYLDEITTPTGYQTAPRMFLIVRSESVEISTDQAEPRTFEPLGINFAGRIAYLSVVNYRIPPIDPVKPNPTISIKKYGNGSTPLDGAIFTLYRHEGDFTTPSIEYGVNLTPTVTSGNAVAFTSTGLVMGNYTLIETTAPTGYILPTGSIRFTVNSDRSISIIKNGDISYTQIFDSVNNIISIDIKNTPEGSTPTGKMKFTKDILDKDLNVADDDDFIAAGLSVSKQYSFDIKIENVNDSSIWYLARVYYGRETVLDGIPLGEYKITEINREPFEFVGFTRISGTNTTFNKVSNEYFVEIEDPGAGIAEIAIKVTNKIKVPGFWDEDEKENLFKSPGTTPAPTPNP